MPEIFTCVRRVVETVNVWTLRGWESTLMEGGIDLALAGWERFGEWASRQMDSTGKEPHGGRGAEDTWKNPK